MTEMGKVFGRTAQQLAADAVRAAVADAGLTLDDVDGLLVTSGVAGRVRLTLQTDLALRDLTLLSEVKSLGATAGAMVQTASMAVASGSSRVVVCVFADTPLKQGERSGAAFDRPSRVPRGWAGLHAASGVTSATALYALAARRHMLTYGTTQEQLGHIAVTQRASALKNPLAQMHDPLSLEDYHESRWVSEPFHLFDCCVVSNGAVAVVVTTADRAGSLPRPAVYVHGWGQSHPGFALRRNDDFGLRSGAAVSGPRAMSMARITTDDVTVAELYDCYTFTALLTLEDYGFCAKGEGGPYVASGGLETATGPWVNTGGGQLSSYYMWGMTPLSEAIIQARGDGGDRQVQDPSMILVSGNGGVLDHHATLVLSPHEVG